jgi:tagatose 1,6-diphosphate aldolase
VAELDPHVWSVGAYRRLARVTNADGHLNVLAVDHRDALRAEFDPANPDSVSAQTLTQFKADMIAGLSDTPSGVMLEPEYSLPQLLQTRSVPASVGVFGALEAQGYHSDPDGSASVNDFMPNWSADQLVRMGGDGAKILVLYRHDRGDHTKAQDRFIRAAVAQAHHAGLPILVEPVPYAVADAGDRRQVIVESTRRIAPMGPMILKVPFPGSDACAELNEAAGTHPWALLSWGVPYEEFRDQLTEAAEHGCAGFTVGRALWREALATGTRAQAVEEYVRPRFVELCAIASRGTSVFDTVPAPNPQPLDNV